LRILDKYLLKELSLTFIAVLTVLLLITFGSEATRLLAEAMQGKVPSELVFKLLLLKIPPALEIILPLVALLAVILAFGRLYQDQEMVVLQSSAIAPQYFKKMVVVFLLPIVLLMVWISMLVSPWTYQQERILLTDAQQISPVSGLVAGKFNTLPNNQGVLYSKEIRADGTMESVWIKLLSAETDLILSAPIGRFEWIEQRVVLVLEDGYSYQGLSSDLVTGSRSVSVQKFAVFRGVLPELTPTKAKTKKFEKPTVELWGSDDLKDQAMLQWRIATPIGILILGLIGLKMSRTGPRQGRFAKIFLALVLYIVFNQLLIVGREAIENGNLPVAVGLWPILLLFAVFAFFEFRFRQISNSDDSKQKLAPMASGGHHESN
jgi:lipopolysaccharide export system permease protein